MTQSNTMRRLLCEKSYEDLISDIAAMTIGELKNKLNEIKHNDADLTKKLELLGVSRESAEHEIEQLISQKQQPDLSTLAKLFENGA